MSVKTLKMPHTVEFSAQWSNSRCLSSRCVTRTHTRFPAFFAPRLLAGFFMAKQTRVQWIKAGGRA
jgi:hypothetical protein